MGHIGLTPQYVHLLGGYKLQGKNALAAERLVEDALILEEAGVFSLVLEMIPWQVAKEISSRLHIPTIGIGAGPWCDGQVLVSYDMLGYTSGQKYRFVKQYANVYDVISNAARDYIKDIKHREFPALSQSFEMPEEEWHQFQDIMARKPQMQRESSPKPFPRNGVKETELGKVYGE
jgi:3-methyl-2-oxobutanoate hydroxymethyltransferase